MSLTTYSGLQAAIANWLNRTDLTAEIPDFISLLESRLAHEVRIPTIEKKFIVNVDSEGYSTIPADFLEIKDIFYNDAPLSRVSISKIHNFVANSGTPIYFAREANKLHFYPIPTMTDSDKLEMIYYHEVAALTDAAPTNILLSTVPELYLYGSLSEASKFLDHLNEGQRWEDAYQQAFARAMMHLRHSEFSGSTPEIFNGYS